MIASLSGIVKATSSSHAVIEVGGIGYGVALPARLAVSLVVGASIDLHTVLVVREDSLTKWNRTKSCLVSTFNLRG